MTLRDADDPALKDDAALKVAWYAHQYRSRLAPLRPPAHAGAGRFLSHAFPDDVPDSVSAAP